MCIYCARKAWYGFVERKILFISDDWLDWSRWSRQVFYRDTNAGPVLDADVRHGLRLAAMPRRCDHRVAAEQLSLRADEVADDHETVLKHS
jgi:hypothetical protein